jgi:hypothetical protein
MNDFSESLLDVLLTKLQKIHAGRYIEQGALISATHCTGSGKETNRYSFAHQATVPLAHAYFDIKKIRIPAESFRSEDMPPIIRKVIRQRFGGIL